VNGQEGDNLNRPIKIDSDQMVFLLSTDITVVPSQDR